MRSPLTANCQLPTAASQVLNQTGSPVVRRVQSFPYYLLISPCLERLAFLFCQTAASFAHRPLGLCNFTARRLGFRAKMIVPNVDALRPY